MSKPGYVYLMTNKSNSVIYTGVTSDLKKRVDEHRAGFPESFTKNYNVCKLVYYEAFDDIETAISLEKQIKGGSRNKKVELIRKSNPEFRDMYGKL
jgi:putative endonuclease